jgi:dTDP-4-amino-4,6-dideoxygalactose transaminase
MCNYAGAKHAVALASGTAAIHLSLILRGVGPGDEVLCSSFTFAGSAFPVTYVGATPVFVDSETDSWNMDPELLSEAIRDRIAKGTKPKACIVVHLYGQPANVDAIAEVCTEHDIALIEDAAESLGAYYNDTHTGTIAPLGILSFNGNKIITSSGGGMLLGHSEEEIARARFLSTQARDAATHYEHSAIGYNYRMSNIVAAIGRAQLESIEERVARRRAIFEFYREQLAEIEGFSFIPEPKWSRSNRWLTCITLDPGKIKTAPATINQRLESENIETRPLWKPMHMQPVFKTCPAYTNGVSENLFKTGLCLPSGNGISNDDLQRVAAALRKALNA